MLPSQGMEMYARTVAHADDLPDPAMVPLLDCWLALRQQNALPSYEDFDVLNLPAEIWPNLIVAEFEPDQDDFMYRVAGSEIDASNGFASKGLYLSEMPIDHEKKLHQEFVAVLNSVQPRVSWGNVVKGDLNFKNVSRLCCPFADRTGEARIIIGVVLFQHSGAVLRKTRISEPND